MDEKVRYWFEQAAPLRVADRVAFIESNCPDEEIRSEVLSLLEFDDDDSGTTSEMAIRGAIRKAVGSVLGEANASVPVQRVGAFELGRLLGSGGMGLVYEAHRVDGQVRQRVAVKFAQAPERSGKLRDDVYRRFCRERQTLASLNHPYIAGLIDAGMIGNAVPYAVIEQVDGVPIDVYCDASSSDESDRIRLVLKLCDAVQFAHRNLIVHGDIKPDNVLVTSDGIPKLIDFGVAHDIGDEPGPNTIRAFTPGYASPEQSRGLAATVASDVYGLGAVLYRLLTGAKPLPVKSGSFGEVIRHMSEADVVRPSAIKPELKGDLENILLKTLEDEPHRRYGSVAELADDLNRFLARRPVRATPDSRLYRTRRFVRRHWGPVLAGGAVAVALATVAVVSVLQRQQALARAAETRHLAEKLLFEVHDEIRGVLGAAKAREKLGAIAVQYLEGLEKDYGRDPELAWELMNAYSRLGQSRGGAVSSSGDTKGGFQFAMKTLELAGAAEASARSTERLDKLFVVYASLAPIFQEARRPTEHCETIDRMLRLAQRLHPMREAQALKELSRYFDDRNALQDSAEALERSLAILRTVSQSPTKPEGFDAQLTSTLVAFGRAQAIGGDFSGAVVSLQEGIRLAESSMAADRHKSKIARQLYWSHIALGDVFGSPSRFSLQRPAEAALHYQKARSIAESFVSADPGNDVAKLDLARTFSREGAALTATEPARAFDLLKRGHSLVMRTSPENYSGLDARLEFLTVSVQPLTLLGDLELARQHTSEGRRLLAEMQHADVKIDDKNLRKAEAIRLYAAGDAREALSVAQSHLALFPEKTSTVLSGNFAAVEVLERIRVYAAGIDAGACASANQRLLRIWEDLRASHPRSRFVAAQLDRVRTLNSRGCGPTL